MIITRLTHASAPDDLRVIQGVATITAENKLIFGAIVNTIDYGRVTKVGCLEHSE
jgi:hypothetical protein